MSGVWRILNVGLPVLGFLGGYASLAPGSIHNSNPDAVLCLLILMAIPIVIIGSIYYAAVRLGVRDLHPPSWIRNPLLFWYDPLQFLFVATAVCFAAAIGSGIRSWLADWAGFWTFGLYCSTVMGLLIARVLAYWIFRNRIT